MHSLARPDANLDLSLLGGFSLCRAGQTITVPAGKMRAVLAFLACNAKGPIAREKLVGLLWCERSEEQARQSFRQVLSMLRRILGSEAIVTNGDEIGLDETIACDVVQFLTLVNAGNRDALREAVALYRGDLLPGLVLAEELFMDWLVAERARLRDLALGAFERLMTRAADDAAPAELFEYAQRALSIDPYREEAHRQLIRALAFLGRRNDALLHYRRLEQTLRDELGVEPEAATAAVMEDARTGKMALASIAPLTPAERPATTGIDADSRIQPKSGRSPGVDRPSIVVLPFDSLGGGTQMARLAAGITEDIISDLSRFRGLDVIAPNSAALSKVKSTDVKQIGKNLSVRYVLKGTIQRQAGQIRVTAQLVDAATIATLWAERWDRPAKDIFAIQTEVAERLAAMLGGMGGSAAITVAETKIARRLPPRSLTAYDHYLLANEGRTLFTAESVAAGIDAATKAITLEPTLGRAYVARAWLNYLQVHHGADFEAAMQGMEADARKAVALDPYDAEARVTLAFYLSGRGRFEDADVQVQTALRANPTNAQVLVVGAALLAWGGQPELGAAMADKALRLDPWMTPENLNCVKDAYFFARRFDDAISAMSGIPSEARGRGTRLMLTLCYALLGRKIEAARARSELLKKYPRISAELLLNQDWVCARKEEEELLLAGFRTADLPLFASDIDLSGIANPRRLPGCQATSVES